MQQARIAGGMTVIVDHLRTPRTVRVLKGLLVPARESAPNRKMQIRTQ
jgi:hypothetical protein